MSFKRYDQNFSNFTPNFEVSEGIRIAEAFQFASYLPLVRFDKRTGDYKVVSGGKVLAVDSNNYVVPAGLALDIQTAIADGDFDGCKNLYSVTDVNEGVKNFAGRAVTANEPVVKSFFDLSEEGAIPSAATLIHSVGKPIGVAPYDGWRQNGAGLEQNPIDYTYTNWNLQESTTVLTRYYIELPVITDASKVAFPGMTVFVGAPKPGDLVTFDALSNLVVASPLAASAFEAGVAGAPTDAELKAEVDRVTSALNNLHGNVLGRVTYIHDKWPKDYLQWVKTWNPNITRSAADTTGVLDKAPGSATAGLPDILTYAGVSDPTKAKIVRINLVIAGL